MADYAYTKPVPGLEAAIYCRALIAGGGNSVSAYSQARNWGDAPQRVVDALMNTKDVVQPVSETWTDANLVGITSAFLGSLQHYGAFDRMLGDMRVVPMPSRYGVVVSGATAYLTGAGQLKPLTSLSVSSSTLAPQKTTALVVMSRELARMQGPPATLVNEVMRQELSSAVATTTDTQFLAILLASAPTVTATGIDARSVRRDIASALKLVTTSAQSKLYIIMNSTLSKALATQFTVNGEAAWEDMTPLGGTLCGMPVVVSDAVTSGDIVVVDAQQIAAASDGVTFRTTSQASVQMSSAPDSPSTTSSIWVGLWQSNLLGLAVERYWGAAVIGSAGVAVVTNASYGDSPSP